jgi:hypothetical protein
MRGQDGHRRQGGGGDNCPIRRLDRQVTEQDVADDDVACRSGDQLEQNVAVGAQPLDQLPFVGAFEGREVDGPNGVEILRPGFADGDAGGVYCALP